MYYNPILGIDIAVKIVDNNGTSQVLVEFWVKKISNLELMDIILKTDTTKLMPTNIEDNTELSDFDKIQYEGDPTDEKRAKSKEVLSNTFEYGQEGLEINTFEYRGQDLIQLTIRANDYSKLISATEDKVLLGKMSFKLDGEIEQNEFSVSRISLICNDNEDGFSRNSIDGEICSELARIEYQLTGSISGQIDIDVKRTKKIATIKVYTKESVEGIDWNAGTKDYPGERSKLPEEPFIQYTTTEEDAGAFLIEDIPCGEYVILVDKHNYLDYIITDVTINSGSEINLSDLIGNIELTLGDFDDKDGKLTLKDKSKLNVGYAPVKDKDPSFDLNDDGKLTLADKSLFNTLYDMHPEKTVISLKDI